MRRRMRGRGGLARWRSRALAERAVHVRDHVHVHEGGGSEVGAAALRGHAAAVAEETTESEALGEELELLLRRLRTRRRVVLAGEEQEVLRAGDDGAEATEISGTLERLGATEFQDAGHALGAEAGD